MYRMSRSEFWQYKIAKARLKELRKLHEIELQEAYDNIHPTRTAVDYHIGRVYVESINPADYAIYLIDLQEEHKRIERWWKSRSDVYNEALSELTDKEKNVLSAPHYVSYAKEKEIENKLQRILERIVTTRPELQRPSIPFDELEDIEEIDNHIENMSEEELLEGYWNLDEQIDEKTLKERCRRLRDVHDMPYSKIAEEVGITNERAKKYASQLD